MTKSIPMFDRARFGLMALGMWMLFAGAALADVARIDAFAGRYSGMVQVTDTAGQTEQRDMSVEIAPTKDGFSVQWVTTIYSAEGDSRQKAYEIDFVDSPRDGIFAAAMARNVFGHAQPLDPMKGEPYVWARISGQTLTVFSLFVNDVGGYEVQQFDRTLAEGGLDLVFHTTRNGQKSRVIETFLSRE